MYRSADGLKGEGGGFKALNEAVIVNLTIGVKQDPIWLRPFGGTSIIKMGPTPLLTARKWPLRLIKALQP
ncbi:hypothetical protein BHE74_00017613 [Ensete ventricosum]|nr:hypothetical protein BHE74_00017613 [Ensete ventricosum]